MTKICPICDSKLVSAYQKRGNQPHKYIAVCTNNHCPTMQGGTGDTPEEAFEDFFRKNIAKQSQMSL